MIIIQDSELAGHLQQEGVVCLTLGASVLIESNLTLVFTSGDK